MSRSKVYLPTDEEFAKIVAEANTYSDCLRALGLGTRGGSSTDILKKRIKELDLSTEHFGNPSKQHYNAKYTLDEILVENSSYTSIQTLKRRLIKENKLPYKCAYCGNTGEWNGKPLVLQLDHINGINNDHRIENLRFLCPNCHSQTQSYSGKNKANKRDVNYCIDCGKKISYGAVRCISCNSKMRISDKPLTRDELKKLIRSASFVDIGNQMNVSDNAIRNWCKKYGLPFRKSEIKEYSDEEWTNV